jgi:uncharacterized tellurite resistance protein B-like protein
MILQGSSDLEKGAYLGAIASIATADRQATQEELDHIDALCEAAGLEGQQKEAVLRAATELSGDELNRCLDVLKTSDLRFSLVTDVIAFAKSDGQYTEPEQVRIQSMAQYLGLNQQQYSMLDQFATKAAASTAPPEERAKPGFLSSLGLDSGLQSAGINGGGLLKGLLGIAGPMLLGSMVSRALGGRRRGGMFGGGGGMFGGGGGMMGGMMGGGGLGSLIGMLSGGRGYGSSGGLLGRIFGGGGGSRW